MGLREFAGEHLLGAEDEFHILTPAPIELGGKFNMVEMIGGNNKQFLVTEEQFEGMQKKYTRSSPYEFIRQTDGLVLISLKGGNGQV
jgi:hypothetical protein